MKRQCEICGVNKYPDEFVIPGFSGEISGLAISFNNNKICASCGKRLRVERRGLYNLTSISEKPLKDRTGFVYVVRCMQYYKIGITKDMESRAKGWQTDNPFDLEVITVFRSDRASAYERALHTRFRRYHHRGEWFQLPESEIQILVAAESIEALITLESDECAA